MTIPTKTPPPIRLRRAPPPKGVALPPPSFDFTRPPASQPSRPPAVVAPVAPVPMGESVPPGPARVMLNHRLSTAVNVLLSPWSCPFRIAENDPANPRGPCTIIWSTRGCGRLRTQPSDFKPIPCVDRREAQELILILYHDWLIDPARASLLEQVRTELRGKLLACHCGPSTPCHGDVLLGLVNKGMKECL